MYFIARDGGQRLVYKPTRNETVLDTSGRAVLQKIRGQRVQFTKLNAPMITTALPTKGGRNEVWGILMSEDAARQSRLSESEVITWLLNHPLYGVEIVGMNEDGRPIDLDSDPNERFVVPSGEDGWFCHLCDKQGKMLGKHFHLKGKTHLANLDEALKGQQFSL